MSVWVLMFQATKIFAFEREEYRVDSGNWIVKKIPEGNSFLCIKCENEIRISITFGPKDKKIKQSLFDHFEDSEEARLAMVDNTIRGQVPAALEPEIEILHNAYGEFFGLRVLAFHAAVYIGEIVTRDTTYLGINDNRIVRITLNYMDGDLDSVASDQVTNFLTSLNFEKDHKVKLIGSYVGLGFEIEKDNSVIFSQKDLYSFDSKLSIEETSGTTVTFISKAEMRLKKGTPLKKDKRVDRYFIQWTDNKSGTLKNLNSKFAKDRSTFSIDGQIMTLRSWIDRNQVWETQIWRKN